MHDTTKPTRVQIEVAFELMQMAKNDVDWYDFKSMTRGQLARLIEKLRDEARQNENKP